MTTQGFFSKLFDSQLPPMHQLNSSSSSSSSSSLVDFDSTKCTIDTSSVTDLLSRLSLDENLETTLPYDPFFEGNEKKLDQEEVVVVKEQKAFPPPITCLKLFKAGKRCTYFSYDQVEKRFVVEDIRVPNRDMFHANREGGRLKLYFGHVSDDEDSQDEEAQVEMDDKYYEDDDEEEEEN